MRLSTLSFCIPSYVCCLFRRYVSISGPADEIERRLQMTMQYVRGASVIVREEVIYRGRVFHRTGALSGSNIAAIS